MEMESITHACIYCPSVAHLWQESSLQSILNGANNESFFDILLNVLQHNGSEGVQELLLISWAAWSARNYKIFNNKDGMELYCYEGLSRFVMEFKAANVLNQGKECPRPMQAIWIPPDFGTLKINSDAAIIAPGVIGLGVVIRDPHGSIVLAASRRIKANWEVALAEAMAIKFGLELAFTRGLFSVWAESDALGVVLGVHNQQQNLTYLGSLFDDIRSLLNFFPCSRLTFVKKGGNCVAHLMARILPEEEGELLYLGNYPPGLTSLAEIDII